MEKLINQKVGDKRESNNKKQQMESNWKTKIKQNNRMDMNGV